MKKQILTSEQFRNILTIEEFRDLGKSLGKKNKYGAKSVIYNGRKYHSTGEANYAMELDWRKESGDIKAITPQYPIKIVVNGVFICRYIIDFKIELKNGQIEYHEYKGAETDLFKIKWKLVKALYPEWNFKLIKK